MSKNYYVYAHFDINGDVFYIGKGTAKRAWQKTNRSSGWNEVAEKGYTVEIITKDLTSSEAIELESAMISYYKEKGKLINKVTKHEGTVIKYEDAVKVFKYDVDSPSCLVRISKTFNGIGHVGKIGHAGYLTAPKSKKMKRYWRVKLGLKGLMAHRVVWVLCNRTDLNPEVIIDHIDGDSLNNNIDNLRACTLSENNKNVQPLSNNTESGYTGIYWDSDADRWRVKWSFNYKNKSKSFYPSKLYPTLDFDIAKEKALQDAFEFRLQQTKSLT